MTNNDRNPAPSGGDELPARTGAEWSILTCSALAWIGLSISILLVQQHAGLSTFFCPAHGGCDAVLSSKYGSFFGVPLPWLGVSFYGIVLTLTLCAYGSAKGAARSRIAGAVLWLTVMAASASAVLMFVQFKLLHSFCPLCTASAVTMFCLAAVASAAEGRAADSAFSGRPTAAWALAIFAIIPATMQLLPRGASNTDTVAIVDGVKFTREQMETDLGATLGPLKQSAFELEFEWARKKVDAALLSMAAAKGMNDPQVELAKRLADVKAASEAEITARLSSKGMADSAESRALVREELLTESREQARIAFMEELARGHQVEVLLEQPKVRALKVDLTTAKISGPRNAKVQLVVFSDFECHFCKELASVLNRVRADFPNDVMLAFRYFPVESHPRAMPAAIAAECAAEQGVFWEYHDRLFADGGDLSDARLTAIAEALKLDLAKFQKCRASDRARSVVERSRADANANRLEGTPTLFLNGKMIGGMIAYEQLAARIREELGAQSSTAEKP